MKTLKTLFKNFKRSSILACMALSIFAFSSNVNAQCDEFADVVAVLNASGCGACHGAAPGQGSWNFSSYSEMLMDGNCGMAGFTTIIPGNAAGSLLIDKINGDGAVACGAGMPTTNANAANEVTVTDLACLEEWINAGAPEFAPMTIPCDLYIGGVIDGPLGGGTPKAVQLCAANDIADLSIYGIGSANNGGGSDGEEFTLPAVPLAAGECIWIASEATEFENFFGAGCAPDYVDGAVGINGDDAIELFENGAVIDVYGDINVDGTGQPWEYTDGWASATDTDCNGGTFSGANWTYSGPDALDGETTNGTAANPYPNPPMCDAVACAIAADLMAAPAAPVVVESTCQADDVTVDGGSVAAITCPAGATAEYSIDGGTTWATTVPTYDQTNAITVTVRCLCDEDMMTASPTAEVMTVPGMCTVCEITDISAGAPVCSADGLTYTVTVTVIGMDANNTVNLDDAGSTEMSQPATGAVVFTYADDASYNITVTDTDGECTFPAITGGPVNCTVLSCGACTEGSAGLVITELSYDPSGTQGNDGDCEYIELFNSYSNTITLDANTTLELSNGASFTFPAGTTIAPGEYIIIAINPAGFGTCNWATSPPAGVQIFGPTTGSLANAGESVDITLACASNPAVDFTQSVTFSDGTTPTAGGGGDAVYYPLDGTGPLASAPTPGSGDCTGCAMTEFLCETVACAIAADLMDAPAIPVVVESTCQPDGVTVDGGSVAAITCPTDATAEYSIDGGTTWSTTVPTYDQTNAITVTVRCLCDEDMMTASPTAEVTTVPGMCAVCTIAADLMTAPAAPVVVESTCQADGVTVDGGSIAAITCPADATAEYSIDGGTTWSTTVPTYDQTNPITVTVRCLCDEDMMTASPTAEVTTIPGMCTPMTCEITGLTVVPTACDPADDTYDLDIDFTVTDPGASGMFNVDVCGTAYGPFMYSALPINIPDLPADGTAGCTVTVTDVDNPGGTVTPAMALYVSFVPDGSGAGGGIDECATESVTVHNFSTDAAGCVDVDISGYQLEDNNGVFYTFPAGTVVPAGGSLTITIDQINMCSGTVGMGDGGGAQFANGGDNVDLLDAASAIVDATGTIDGDPGTEYESPGLTAAGGAGSAMCTSDACSAAMDYDAPASCMVAAMCTLVLDPETVTCDAETAGTDTYTVTIPFDNGAEGTPGSMNYTVTTSGTLGGDNPMVVQSGTITITFTEGMPYDYSIQGVAGSGANEACDITISGDSPACDPAPACTLVLDPETVTCDAETAGTDTYTVTIPFDNGAEGTPGSMNYTVTTSGTLGGDNPMVVQSGTITITFTEGMPYDYSIQGVAGSGANETCDIMISGNSPACDPVPTCTLILGTETVTCDAETAGTDTYTVNIPFDNGAEGTPGSMNYTVTTSGTLGGDNPMVVQSGFIMITFTEGMPYDYSIQGVMGSGANETCDFTITGDSPICEPVVCEDEIAGMVVADASCDLTGVTVTITDDMGTVITTLTTDAAGIYDSTPMVFPCGNYMAQLTAGVPACYSGDTGPRPFTIDGDTAMTDTDGVIFGNIMAIPTVGEWGLIILALLMCIVAVAGIKERNITIVKE